jgi:hypothetical protein
MHDPDVGMAEFLEATDNGFVNPDLYLFVFVVIVKTVIDFTGAHLKFKLGRIPTCQI